MDCRFAIAEVRELRAVAERGVDTVDAVDWVEGSGRRRVARE